MKDLFTYLVIIVVVTLLLACNPNPEIKPTGVDTIDVPCTSGSTVQLLCDTVLIPLSCGEGNEVSCGNKIYIAKPVTAPESMIDTIPSPTNDSTYPRYHGMQLPTHVIRTTTMPSSTGINVDTIDINISCEWGSIVYIVCGEEVIPLPCNEESVVTCGIYNYVAAPVDTID